jgi:hypothetical protein
MKKIKSEALLPILNLEHKHLKIEKKNCVGIGTTRKI